MEGNLIPGLSKKAGLEFYESPPTQVLGSLPLFQVFLNSFFPFFAKPSKDAKIGALPQPVEGLTSTHGSAGHWARLGPRPQALQAQSTVGIGSPWGQCPVTDRGGHVKPRQPRSLGGISQAESPRDSPAATSFPAQVSTPVGLVWGGLPDMQPSSNPGLRICFSEAGEEGEWGKTNQDRGQRLRGWKRKDSLKEVLFFRKERRVV